MGIKNIFDYKGKGQRGFSLVTVLVMVALLVTFVAIVSQFTVLSERTRNSIIASNAPMDVESMIQNLVSDEIRSFVKPPRGCSGSFNIDESLSKNIRLRKTTAINIPSGLPPPSLHTTAITRCSNKPFFRPNAANPYGFYFCIQLDNSAKSKTESYQKDSILNSEYFFGEYYARMFTSHDGGIVGCGVTKTGKYPLNASIEVFYTFYFAVKTKSGVIYKSRNKSFITNL